MEMETFFQLKIDSLLMTASWVERLRSELGLVGVSQVWAQSPAWYLWLEESPGAYGLELADAAAADQAVRETFRGLFTIRYYPSPEEPGFADFSPREQALVRGSGFDHSGTPRLEALPDIPPDFFVVGTLELSLEPEAPWALFGLSALDSCRCLQAPEPGLPRQVVRRVSGQSLCKPLFHSLLGLYAFSSRHTPLRARLCEEPGMQQVQTRGEVIWQKSDEASLQSLEVLMGSEPGSQPRAARRLLDESGPVPPGRVLLDQSFSCSHYHGPEEPFGGRPLLSPSWWHLAAADYKSELASSCGCEH